MKSSQFIASSTAILFGLGLSAASQAQVLEEVVVTAQKREQQAQDVGISITAYSGDQIDALGYTNAQQVAAMAPGVSTVQPNGEANYALGIRGAVNSDFTANQESPISIYVDEVYISQMSGAGFMLFDLERVEILRGPQGTLFGRNATGGLAHFITRKPTQERDAYGQFTFGEYDQVKFQGAIGGGLTEDLSARFSVATHHNSGYVNNRLSGSDLNNANDYAGRVQFLWDPTDQVEFLFNGRYSLQQIRTGFFENKSSRPLGPGGTGVLTPGQGNFNGYEDTDGDVFAGDYDKLGHNDLETYGFTGTFKFDFGMFDFTSITDYQAVKRDYIEDSDASPFNDSNLFLSTDSVQWSQEARLHGQTDKLDWVAGFYYLDIEFSDANGVEVRSRTNGKVLPDCAGSRRTSTTGTRIISLLFRTTVRRTATATLTSSPRSYRRVNIAGVTTPACGQRGSNSISSGTTICFYLRAGTVASRAAVLMHRCPRTLNRSSVAA
jgi:iron complex outermembrane receptor protein